MLVTETWGMSRNFACLILFSVLAKKDLTLFLKPLFFIPIYDVLCEYPWKQEKWLKTPKKVFLTSFRMCAMPESWLKYTTDEYWSGISKYQSRFKENDCFMSHSRNFIAYFTAKQFYLKASVAYKSFLSRLAHLSIFA